MNSIKFTLILILFVQTAISQTASWTELAPSCVNTKFKLEHVSDRNHMVGSFEEIGETLISLDDSKTWRSFIIDDSGFDQEIKSEQSFPTPTSTIKQTPPRS